MRSRWDDVHQPTARIHARFWSSTSAEDAPAIVLVHGIGVSSRYMVPAGRCLGREYAVYAPDLPGFGKSSKPARMLDTSGLAAHLLAWTRAVHLDRAVLVGNLYRRQIIVQALLSRPPNVLGAVLQGPTVDPCARSAVRQIVAWIRNSVREPVGMAPVVARDYLDCGARRLVGTFQAALQDRIEDKLPRVEVPTLVVRGRRDAIVSQGWAEDAARLLPKGRLALIDGAHTVNFSNPQGLADVVNAFVQEIAT